MDEIYTAQDGDAAIYYKGLYRLRQAAENASTAIRMPDTLAVRDRSKIVFKGGMLAGILKRN